MNRPAFTHFIKKERTCEFTLPGGQPGGRGSDTKITGGRGNRDDDNEGEVTQATGKVDGGERCDDRRPHTANRKNGLLLQSLYGVASI